jgi:hypothetical protein
MECPVCFDSVAPYKINCGSRVPHYMCHPCELNWRLKMAPTRKGRILTCPICRTNEPNPGNRSVSSLQNELTRLYMELFNPAPERYMSRQNWLQSLFDVPASRAPVAPVHVPVAPVHAVERPEWCKSGRRELDQCSTKGKTSRKCKYAGCNRKVCRSCNMCITH